MWVDSDVKSAPLKSTQKGTWMSKITVIGTGFGALTAIRKLRAADAGVHIDVVAPNAEFVYYPGTIWIPTGLRKPEDLVVPLDNFFRRMNINFHKAAVTGSAGRGACT